MIGDPCGGTPPIFTHKVHFICHSCCSTCEHSCVMASVALEELAKVWEKKKFHQGYFKVRFKCDVLVLVLDTSTPLH